MRKKIIVGALLSTVVAACDKIDNPILPPPPPKTDCIVTFVGSSDNNNGNIQTQFFNSPQRRLDSTRNPYTFTKYYYQDSLIIKREVMYTNGRQVRNYDSLFYNTDGTLQRIKMVDFDNTALVFVNDINLYFTYTGKQLTKFVKSEQGSGNIWYDITTEYTYDLKSNITQAKHTFANGSSSYDKYYYTDTDNFLPKLKIPIGLLLHNEGLNWPGFISSMLPLYLSAKTMNKWDDASGNTGIPVEIITGYPMAGIAIKMNGIVINGISLSCQ